MIFKHTYLILHLQDRLISDQKGCTYKNNGIVYSVLYVAKYALKKNDCNKVPKVKCTFRNGVKPVLFKGNQTFKCAGMFCVTADVFERFMLEEN